MSMTDYGSPAVRSAGLFGIKPKDSKPTRPSTSPSLSQLMPTSLTSSLPAAKKNSEKFGHQEALHPRRRSI
jgi:hypothetical protein